MFRRVIDKVAKCGIDGYLVQHPDNMKWLCNKSNYFVPGTMLITGDEVFLITKSRNISALKQVFSDYRVLFGDVELLTKLCSEKRVKTIGFESNRMSVAAFDNLRSSVDTEWVPLPDFVEDLRMIKTAEELDKIREAVEVADKAYVEFLNHLRVGLTEIEAKNIFRSLFFKHGADDLSFDILLSSGKRTFLPHSVSTGKEIAKGDLVLMDFGVVVNGYCSDTTRTVVMGSATEKQRELYDLVLRAQEKALGSIRAGMTTKEADAYAREVIMSECSNGCYDYGLGHGIGMTVHEKPRMSPHSEYVLEENTVVSVEPGVYLENWGGIRIEDLLVIGKTNPGSNLTGCTKELTVLK